jgi:hypothetical protein
VLREAIERVMRERAGDDASGLGEAFSVLRGLIDRVAEISVRAWRSAERTRR